MRTTSSFLRRAGTDCFNVLLDICLGVVSRGMKKELARRDAARGRNALRWFTPEEAITAEALANIIVPSDDETPGIGDVDVLGPPAIVVLDNMVTASPHRHYLYSRGLLAFDAWALKERGCEFASMPKEDQIMLFRDAQQIYEDWTAKAPAATKAWRRFRAISQSGSGSVLAAQLYPQITTDCLQIFYTSRVSWVWLDYDGPPMDEGYPSVTARR